MSAFIITIDGPSGSGKGTIASKLAQQYGYKLLDSGALYRLLGLAVHQAGLLVTPLDVSAVEHIAKNLNIDFVHQVDDSTGVFLNGQNVTQQIRTEEVGSYASKVAVVPALRDALLQRQHDFARGQGLVADGRDMGTVVFPQASAKIYLTASAEARATRRVKQLQQMGVDAKIADILADLKSRDKRDMERDTAPLKPAEDALIVDCSALSIEQVLSQLTQYIDQKQQVG